MEKLKFKNSFSSLYFLLSEPIIFYFYIYVEDQKQPAVYKIQKFTTKRNNLQN